MTPLKVTKLAGTSPFITRGMRFPKGAVPKGQSFALDSAATQVHARARHSDGSLKFASYTARIPATGVTGWGLVSDAPLAGNRVAAQAKDDRVVLKMLGGGTLTAEAKNCKWLPDTIPSGPLVHERKGVVALTPHIRVYFWIRQYADASRVVRVSVENMACLIPSAQVEQYDVQVFVDGKSVYAKTGIKHFHGRHWTLTFPDHAPAWHVWQGLDYLKTTGMLPNYNPARTFSKTDADAAYKAWLKSPHGILEQGVYSASEHATGERGELALYSDSDVFFLLSGDPRLEEAVTGMGDLAGGWETHWRYEVTGLPLLPQELPKFSCNPNLLGHPGCAPKEDKKGLVPKLKWDNAHAPSMGTLAYLLTGDDYYREEGVFWALAQIYETGGETRGFEKGLVNWSEVRSQAWFQRSIADAADLESDDSPQKAPLLEILDFNLKWWSGPGLYTDHGILKRGIGDGKGAHGPATCAPWQENFKLVAASHCADLGFTAALPEIAWRVKFNTHCAFDLDSRIPTLYHLLCADHGSKDLWPWPKINAENLKDNTVALAGVGPGELLSEGEAPNYVGDFLAATAMASRYSADARKAYDAVATRLATTRKSRPNMSPIDWQWDIVP